MLELGEFQLDLSVLKEACINHSAKRIAVQIPAILQNHSAELTKDIEDACSVNVFMGSHPSYGACDLFDTSTLSAMGIDLLANFGHAELPNITELLSKESNIPVIFVELPSKITEIKLTKKDIERLGKSVALAAPVQYIHLLPKIEELLKENDVKAYIGSGDGRIKYPGQVLGCNYTAIKSPKSAKIESYLYVGTGRFHPLGIALSVDKPLFSYDPQLGILINFEMRRERFLRQRHAMIAKAQESKNFGIIVSSKPGQRRTSLALELQKKLRSKKKNTVIYIADELDPSDFDYADIDIIVSTACPRIALDDAQRYKKPIITPIELEIALKIKKWEKYCPDTITS